MYESVHFHTEQAGGREYLIVEQHNMPTHKFEIVDRVPLGYHVWNIGENMPDGYLPLCRLCASQPFEGATAIDPSTIKAIRSDGSKEIMRAANYVSAPLKGLASKMEKALAIAENRLNSASTKETTKQSLAVRAERIREALPHLKALKI